MNIFVAKLSGDTTSEDLHDLFSSYGEVTSAKVIMDRETGMSKRFGFVEMSNDDDAQKAITELDQAEYDHHVIVVKKARPKEDRPQGGFRRPGGGGGGGGFRDRQGGGGFRSGGGSRPRNDYGNSNEGGSW